MFEEYEKQKRAHHIRMIRVREYGMGGLFLLVGFFFLLRGHLPLTINLRFPPDNIDPVYGSLCLLYGSWRIYRGYQAHH